MKFRLRRWKWLTWSVCCRVLLGMDPAELGQFWCRAGASTYRGSSACGTEGAAPEEAPYGGGGLFSASTASARGSETYPGKKKGIRRRQLNLLCFFFFFLTLWDFSFCVMTVVSWAESWKYNVKAHKFNITWKGRRMNKYICLPGNILC